MRSTVRLPTGGPPQDEFSGRGRGRGRGRGVVPTEVCVQVGGVMESHQIHPDLLSSTQTLKRFHAQMLGSATGTGGTGTCNANIRVDECKIGKEKAKEVHHIRYQKDANENNITDHYHKNTRFNLVTSCTIIGATI